ncbi:hypothetical protein BDZ45DRAFT_741118 [Acephala macrosclerotiorum]|nr:hypothetical protein BDZ45DRAFT_741118 [Acephala macrosclerotiorum]
MARADKSALVTAAWRLNGLTRTRREVNAFYYQCLTNTEEELLIARINKLINREMLSTSQIVKNLVEEIKGKEVKKN